MSSNRPRHMHGPGGYGQAGAGEKAKDLKKTGKKLLVYMGRYKIALVFVLLFAIAGRCRLQTHKSCWSIRLPAD